MSATSSISVKDSLHSYQKLHKSLTIGRGGSLYQEFYAHLISNSSIYLSYASISTSSYARILIHARLMLPCRMIRACYQFWKAQTFSESIDVALARWIRAVHSAPRLLRLLQSEVCDGDRRVTSVLSCRRYSQLLSKVGDDRLYFVHSFRALPSSENDDWILATTKYGTDFISVLERGNISATQFHPEKSGAAGLAVLRGFLEKGNAQAQTNQHTNGDCFKLHPNTTNSRVDATSPHS